MQAVHVLASGRGWRVADVVCSAGPRDRPFEEQHDGMFIAIVSQGTFCYRTTQGTALLVPGALLLGNDQHCFQCRHDHATGDRCLSFRFTPEFMETIVEGAPGATRVEFAVPHVPPSAALIAVAAAAEAARDDGDSAAYEELAVNLAGAVATGIAGMKRSSRSASTRDQRRITAALWRIESHAQGRLTLVDLARCAAMSPYHFLRTFREVTGTTPHQYLLHRRLHQAAMRLRRTRDNVSSVALEAGFNDLSTFNRRFRRVMGVSPGVYRARCA